MRMSRSITPSYNLFPVVKKCDLAQRQRNNVSRLVYFLIRTQNEHLRQFIMLLAVDFVFAYGVFFSEIFGQVPCSC